MSNFIQWLVLWVPGKLPVSYVLTGNLRATNIAGNLRTSYSLDIEKKKQGSTVEMLAHCVTRFCAWLTVHLVVAVKNIHIRVSCIFACSFCSGLSARCWNRWTYCFLIFLCLFVKSCQLLAVVILLYFYCKPLTWFQKFPYLCVKHFAVAV